MLTQVAEIVTAMQRLAPLSYAESWDNVGLLIGHREDTVDKVLLTIDYTEDVLEEAIDGEFRFIVSYHPIMFHPVTRITDDEPTGRMLLNTMHHRINVYSPHTALDAAPGGITDWLADALGTGYRRPLVPYEALGDTQEIKVVTFVPLEALDQVRNALASAGAGRIHAYEHCSFSVTGIGTFRGNETTNPTVGEPGQLEQVEESRLEMVCAGSALPVLIETLRHFHPYEEPAFDLYPLHPIADLRVGAGRKVVLDQPTTVGELAVLIKEHLGIPYVKTTHPNKEVQQVGLVPGAGASLMNDAINQDCNIFITGEMKHHEALSAEQRGCSIILTGHTNSERGYLPTLSDRLHGLIPDLDVMISERDRTRLRVL